MKILFITSWFPTETNPVAGVFVKEHAKAVSMTGNEVVILALVVHRSKDFFRKTVKDFHDENGIRTILIEIFTRFHDVVYHAIPLQNSILNKIIKRNLSDFQPDIFHSNVVFPAGVWGNRLSKRLKKPHIISEHWSRLSYLLKKPVLSVWAKNAYKNADAILPVSAFLKKNIQALVAGIDEQKFVIVGNIVDENIFKYQEKNQNSDIRFCAVAAWNRHKQAAKQPELFIKAISALPDNVKKHIELTIVGGGNMLKEMKQLAEKQSFKIRFTGALPKTGIAEILQSSDYFLHASNIETFGIVTAEALLCGTPVICSNVGALPELINATNGILCQNTVEDWTKGMLQAINHQYDNQRIADEIKGKFNYASIGEKINEVYIKIKKNTP